MSDNKTKDVEKRGAKGGGTVRQRPDGRWEARCTINGKRRSFYGDKQADVLKAMREAQKEKDDGTYCDPKRMTFGEWLDIWLEEYSKPTIKSASYRARKNRIKNHIKPELGKIQLRSLNTTHIQAFYNKLRDNKKLSTGTIKGYHATIGSALKQAVRLRYIPINPAGGCVLPKKEKKEITPLSEKDIENFLREAEKDESYGDLLIVALFTGMRQGEICGLPWNAIDFQKGTITVKQQLCQEKGPRKEYYIGSTKNGQVRTLTPPPFIMDLLKEVRKKQIKNHLAVGLAWKNDFDLVFTDTLGNCIVNRVAYYHFKKIATKIGRPDARFHDLRHTYAVISLQEGDNPKTVQHNLGHATAEFTLNVYAHVSEKMKKDSAERMQAYYNKLKA